MTTAEDNPSDWFALAAERLRAADALRAAIGVTPSTVELLQEAVERFLKGYLVAKGWRLKKIHNLATLLDEAVAIDRRFEAFADLCERLTAQFWAQHYPGGDLEGVGDDYDDLRRSADGLIELIRHECPGFFPDHPA